MIKQVFILAKPSRKHENLISFMSNIFEPKNIHCTSQYKQIKDMLIENQPTIILMHPQAEVSCIVQILPLLSHPQQITHFDTILSDGIIYADFRKSQFK